MVHLRCKANELALRVCFLVYPASASIVLGRLAILSCCGPALVGCPPAALVVAHLMATACRWSRQGRLVREIRSGLAPEALRSDCWEEERSIVKDLKMLLLFDAWAAPQRALPSNGSAACFRSRLKGRDAPTERHDDWRMTAQLNGRRPARRGARGSAARSVLRALGILCHTPEIGVSLALYRYDSHVTSIGIFSGL